MSIKKKILFIDNRSQYFVAHRLSWATALRDRGVDVHVTTLSRRDEDIARLQSEHMLFHRLRSNANNISLVKPMLMAGQLAALVNKLEPDLIHVVTLKAMCVASLALLIARKSPTIMAVTGLGFAFTSSSLKASLVRLGIAALAPLIRKAGQVFILQNQDDLTFFNRFFRIPRERLCLIKGVGVDTAKFYPVPETDGKPVVVLPARMLRDKGVFEFVEASRYLQGQGVGARFILVGDTDPENPTAIPDAQLKAWHDSGVVEFLGYSNNMLSVYEKAHIVCLPSYGEGLPTVIMEAAACGRPVVATDVPGCREVICHEETGLLVPPKDSLALAGALHRLIADRGLRAAMGGKGRQLVERELSKEKILAHLFQVYNRELGDLA